MSELGSQFLRYERRGPVAWCIVDRPKPRNVMTRAMYRGIGEAVRLTAADEEAKVLVITGTDAVFIPGGDMNPHDEDPPADVPVLPFNALRHSPVPVVTAVNGLCQASGLLFTALADVSIASERATFRAVELLRGLPDMWLAGVLPEHIGAGRTRDLGMTGRVIDAEEALRIGLVTRVASHDQLLDDAEAAAYQLLEAAPHARDAWRRAVNARYGVIDEMTMDAALVGDEVAEGFQSYLEKRPPHWVVERAPR